MINKTPLYIFLNTCDLWDYTDEEHPAATADIIQYLASIGITAMRKTVAEDAAELQNSSFDIVCTRSRQNEYFIGSHHLELAELKLLVDAVQAGETFMNQVELSDQASYLTYNNCAGTPGILANARRNGAH